MAFIVGAANVLTNAEIDQITASMDANPDYIDTIPSGLRKTYALAKRSQLGITANPTSEANQTATSISYATSEDDTADDNSFTPTNTVPSAQFSESDFFD